MLRTVLSKKARTTNFFFPFRFKKIHAVNVNSGHIHNTQCLQRVNMFVITSAPDYQMAERDSC